MEDGSRMMMWLGTIIAVADSRPRMSCMTCFDSLQSRIEREYPAMPLHRIPRVYRFAPPEQICE